MPSVASAGTDIASLVLGITGQHEAAVAQDHAEKEKHLQITRAARQNYEISLGQLQYRSNQDQALASQQSMSSKENFLQARGKEVTQAAAHGVAGNTVDALYNQFGTIEHQNQQTIAQNLEWQQQQIYQQELSARASAQQQIALDQPVLPAMPNIAASVIQGAGVLLKGFDTYLKDSGPPASTTPPATNPATTLPPDTPYQEPGDYAGEVNT